MDFKTTRETLAITRADVPTKNQGPGVTGLSGYRLAHKLHLTTSIILPLAHVLYQVKH